MHKSYLFICGAPRSGTSALTVALNALSGVHVGMEEFPEAVAPRDRYALSPADFAFDAYRQRLESRPKGRNINALLSKFKTACVIGDKHPHHHRHFDILSDDFPGCQFVFIFRDVTEVGRSFQRRFEDPKDSWKLRDFEAVNYWCSAARNVLAFHEAHSDRCAIVSYKHLFASGRDASIARANSLRFRLAATMDVGQYDTTALDRLFNVSDKKSSEKQRRASDEAAALFEAYSQLGRAHHWSVEEYREMYEKLQLLDAQQHQT